MSYFHSSLQGFLLPGHGIIKETWYRQSDMSLDSYESVPDYPNCPHKVENMDSFSDVAWSAGTQHNYQRVRYKGYFVPIIDGYHEFCAICNDVCLLKFEADPHILTDIIRVNRMTSQSWDW